MKLGMFMMPLHPPSRQPWETLAEDREAILLADRLGFAEAYVGEHVTDLAENITSCMMFLASLAHETKDIKLGTGTINMPNTHPATVAAQVAMLDHMLKGRFIMGISPGGLMSDAEVFGNYQKDRNAIFLESINMVLDIWKGEAPYNLSRAVLQRHDREDHDPRDRPGRDPQAVPEAAPADRRHRGGAAFEGRDRGGQARLAADLGQLPAARVGREPLAALRRGPAGGGRAGEPRGVAGGEDRSSSPTTRRRRSATATRPRGRTSSTSSSSCGSW